MSGQTTEVGRRLQRKVTVLTVDFFDITERYVDAGKGCFIPKEPIFS